MIFNGLINQLSKMNIGLKCYISSNLIRLITSDGDIIPSCLPVLLCRFTMIEDLVDTCPSIDTIQLVITTEELSILFFALDTNRNPTTDADWISILRAADYMNLKETSSGMILSALDVYLLQTKNVTFWTDQVSFQDYIKKILDPNYLNATEQKLKEERKNLEARCAELKVMLNSLYGLANQSNDTSLKDEYDSIKNKLSTKPYRVIRCG
jgi:hypothetical protein